MGYEVFQAGNNAGKVRWYSPRTGRAACIGSAKCLPVREVRISLNNRSMSTDSSICLWKSLMHCPQYAYEGHSRLPGYVHSIQRHEAHGVLLYGSNGAPSRSALIWNARNLENSLDIPKSPDVCQIAGSVGNKLAFIDEESLEVDTYAHGASSHRGPRPLDRTRCYLRVGSRLQDPQSSPSPPGCWC